MLRPLSNSADQGLHAYLAYKIRLIFACLCHIEATYNYVAMCLIKRLSEEISEEILTIFKGNGYTWQLCQNCFNTILKSVCSSRIPEKALFRTKKNCQIFFPYFSMKTYVEGTH